MTGDEELFPNYYYLLLSISDPWILKLMMYLDLYELKSSKIMKFDIFSRKKFKCTICDEKFKTQRELTEHKHIRHGATR